jgi:DNA-binding XRE family transcriptional regulator
MGAKNKMAGVRSLAVVVPSSPLASRALPDITPSSLSRWHQRIPIVFKACRCEANLTQDELSDRLGWRRGKVVRIENGLRRVLLAELLVIAGAVNLTPEQLLARVLYS